jgi:hypothetical protein
VFPLALFYSAVIKSSPHSGRFYLQLSLYRFVINKQVSSTGDPQPDGALKKAARIKIRHYRQIYADRPDPVVFLPTVVSTSGRVYEDFTRMMLLQHAHRETRILAGELPEESEHFRFLRASRLANLKGSVGLILSKSSVMRVTPIDLSTNPFIPLPRYFNSRRVSPLLNHSLVLIPQQSA